MERRKISLLPALAVLILLVSACSKKMDYTQVIPSDAAMVMVLDINSLSDKAGLNSSENEKLKLTIIDAIKSGLSAASLVHVEKVLKEPSESGISTKDPFYLFASPSFSSPVFVAKVSDAKKLRTSLDVMANEKITQPVTEADGYNYVIMGHTMLAYNKSSVLITETGGEAQQEMIARLLRYEVENTIHQNAYYQKMEKKKGDILFYASLGTPPNSVIQQMITDLPSDLLSDDLILIADLSFEKGKIASHIEFHTDSEELKSLLEKQDKATGKINGALLSDFPLSTLAFFTINVNGKEIYSLLEQNEQFRKTFSLENAAQLKDLFHSFKGDISAGLINVTMSNAPTFVAYAETDKSAAIDALYEQKSQLKLRKGEDILKLGTNEYVYKSRGMNIFFGVKNKHIYATNDELIYKNIGGSNDKSLKDARYASSIKGSKIYAVVDLEAIAELPLIKMMISFGNKQFSTYYDIFSRFSYFEITGSSGQQCEITLYMKEKNSNALKQIIDMAKQYSGF